MSARSYVIDDREKKRFLLDREVLVSEDILRQEMSHIFAHCWIYVCYRYRRYERVREYVGGYHYVLRRLDDSFCIKERRVLIDAHELGSLGSVSFIL